MIILWMEDYFLKLINLLELLKKSNIRLIYLWVCN